MWELSEKANRSSKLIADEAQRLAKMQPIFDNLKREENVQNSQLQTWLSQNE